jgi:choline-glycine betaine transporter
VPLGETTQIVLVIGITAIALVSVLAGLDAGVKRLSEINMVLALLLVLFVIVVGPDAGHRVRLLRQPGRLPAVPAGAGQPRRA